MTSARARADTGECDGDDAGDAEAEDAVRCATADRFVPWYGELISEVVAAAEMVLQLLFLTSELCRCCCCWRAPGLALGVVPGVPCDVSRCG